VGEPTVAPCWRCNPHGTAPPEAHAEWCPEDPAVEGGILREPTPDDYHRAHRAIGACPKVCFAERPRNAEEWCDACDSAWDRLECATAIAGEFVVERERAAAHLEAIAAQEEESADGFDDPKTVLAQAKRYTALALRQEAHRIRRGKVDDDAEGEGVTGV
jgi:hypothetical protein